MELGLRERKKLATRRRIAAAAAELFAAEGFEQVPVARVAKAAEVSEATVFNYFPAKEDLVYDDMTDFAAAVLDAVRDRAGGTSVLDAFRAAAVRPANLTAEAVDRIAAVARVVADSPALRARERQVYDRFTDDLAALLAEDGITSWVTANALVGVNRALQRLVHEMALAGHTPDEIAAATEEQGAAAFDLLARGL